MAAVYERVRLAVIFEATRPSTDDPLAHAANQEAFRTKLRSLCGEARLRPDMSMDELWWHVWSKVRYAGFRASYATEEISRLEPFFNDFQRLAGPEWRFGDNGPDGEAVREFLARTGRFAGVGYNRNRAKLRKILNAAEAVRAMEPGPPALEAFFGPDCLRGGDDIFWRAHGRLARLVGYTTALHVMMDVGFPCVKPDVWLVRLMCRLGWIEPVLPAMAPDALIKKVYQRPAVAEAVITCARRIAEVVEPWHPEAPLREIDFVMVKYGQRPGEFGMTRSLHEEWLPIERIMDWRPGAVAPVAM
jgi:hypothetical protein